MALSACLFAVMMYAAVASARDEPVAATTRAATAPAADAGPLLDALDADDYAAREAAEDALVAAVLDDPSLRPAVEKAADADARPEVRARCASALLRLEEQRLFGQTRVTLHRRGAGDRELVEAFAAAAGVQFTYWPANLFEAQPNRDPADPNAAAGADLDLDGEGFFPALAALCRATGLGAMQRSPNGDRGGGDIYLARSNGRWGGSGFFDPDLPTCPAGAFAVQLVSLYRTRSDTVQLARGPDGAVVAKHNPGDQFSLSMRVLVEPKVRLSAGLDAPRLDEAVDDRGNSVISARQDSYGSYYGGTGWSYDVQTAAGRGQARRRDEFARAAGAAQRGGGGVERDAGRAIRRAGAGRAGRRGVAGGAAGGRRGGRGRRAGPRVRAGAVPPAAGRGPPGRSRAGR